MKPVIFLITILAAANIYGQDIAWLKAADSLKPEIKSVIVTGNEITKDEIILREMTLKKGKKFNLESYADDLRKIYNLGLFTKVDILPLPVTDSVKHLSLNVNVQERWYIFPLPQGGIEDGEWEKKWVGLKIRWDNFRGRNETAMLNFRILYNPYVSVSYSVPWIGERLHLYASISGGYSKYRNQSLVAVGKESGGTIIHADDYNYDNTEYYSKLTAGKYISGNISVFADLGYNYLRVSQYDSGRTISPGGIDKYLTAGPGMKYDSRDLLEFATQGFYLNTNYLVYGFLDPKINFSRFNFETQSFIPVYFTNDYYISAASRLFISFARGEVPIYQHQYLGYSDDYVRGWKGPAFEGEDKFTLYNEFRIPLVKPRYIGAKKIAVIKNLPIVGKMNLKYGLYLTLLYDVGLVWNRGDNIFNKRFLSGTGIGLNTVLPFGYILRTEWNFRLGKPTVGQFGLSLSAKF